MGSDLIRRGGQLEITGGRCSRQKAMCLHCVRCLGSACRPQRWLHIDQWGFQRIFLRKLHGIGNLAPRTFFWNIKRWGSHIDVKLTHATLSSAWCRGDVSSSGADSRVPFGVDILDLQAALGGLSLGRSSRVIGMNRKRNPTESVLSLESEHVCSFWGC